MLPGRSFCHSLTIGRFSRGAILRIVGLDPSRLKTSEGFICSSRKSPAPSRKGRASSPRCCRLCLSSFPSPFALARKPCSHCEHERRNGIPAGFIFACDPSPPFVRSAQPGLSSPDIVNENVHDRDSRTRGHNL